MRKKNFLKAVSIFACFSILMLSVPGVIASEITVKKSYTYHMITKTAAMFSIFFPFLDLKANDESGATSSDQTSSDDSVQKIKIAGTLSSVRPPSKGTDKDGK